MASSSKESKECCFHLEHVLNENCQVITELSWIKVVSCSREWLDLSGVQSEMAIAIQHFLNFPFDEVLNSNPHLGFHATCYRRYTGLDSKRILAAKRNRERSTTETVEESPLPDVVKKPRRSREGPVRSNPVLPVKCIRA